MLPQRCTLSGISTAPLLGGGRVWCGQRRAGLPASIWRRQTHVVGLHRNILHHVQPLTICYTVGCGSRVGKSSANKAAGVGPLHQSASLLVVRAAPLGTGTAPPGGSSLGDNSIAIVRFYIKYEAGFGNYLKIVGSHEELGAWDPRAAPTMEWGDGHLWTTAIQVQEGTEVEYKFVVVSGGGDVWEGGPNRSFELEKATFGAVPIVTVTCTWEDPDATEYDYTVEDGSAALAEKMEAVEDDDEDDGDDPIVRLSPEERSAITEYEKDGLVAVTFSLPYQAGANESIKLVGNNKKLGKWELEDAPSMKFNPETGMWTFAARIPVATILEYKFVLITATGTTCWEGCDNRESDIVPPDSEDLAAVKINCLWNQEKKTTYDYITVPEGMPRGSAVSGLPVALRKKKKKKSVEDDGDLEAYEDLDPSLRELSSALDKALRADEAVSDLLIEEVYRSQDLDSTLATMSESEDEDAEEDDGEDYLPPLLSVQDPPAPPRPAAAAAASPTMPTPAAGLPVVLGQPGVEANYLNGTTQINGTEQPKENLWGALGTPPPAAPQAPPQAPPQTSARAPPQSQAPQALPAAPNMAAPAAGGSPSGVVPPAAQDVPRVPTGPSPAAAAFAAQQRAAQQAQQQGGPQAPPPPGVLPPAPTAARVPPAAPPATGPGALSSPPAAGQQALSRSPPGPPPTGPPPGQRMPLPAAAAGSPPQAPPVPAQAAAPASASMPVPVSTPIPPTAPAAAASVSPPKVEQVVAQDDPAVKLPDGAADSTVGKNMQAEIGEVKEQVAEAAAVAAAEEGNADAQSTAQDDLPQTVSEDSTEVKAVEGSEPDTVAKEAASETAGKPAVDEVVQAVNNLQTSKPRADSEAGVEAQQVPELQAKEEVAEMTVTAEDSSAAEQAPQQSDDDSKPADDVVTPAPEEPSVDEAVVLAEKAKPPSEEQQQNILDKVLDGAAEEAQAGAKEVATVPVAAITAAAAAPVAPPQPQLRPASPLQPSAPSKATQDVPVWMRAGDGFDPQVMVSKAAPAQTGATAVPVGGSSAGSSGAAAAPGAAEKERLDVAVAAALAALKGVADLPPGLRDDEPVPEPVASGPLSNPSSTVLPPELETTTSPDLLTQVPVHERPLATDKAAEAETAIKAEPAANGSTATPAADAKSSAVSPSDSAAEQGAPQTEVVVKPTSGMQGPVRKSEHSYSFQMDGIAAEVEEVQDGTIVYRFSSCNTAVTIRPPSRG